MEKGTYPPSWISKIDLSTYMDRTVVYYDGNLAEAIGQVTKRVPCILNGQRRYDIEKFYNFFGYRESGWNRQGSVAISTTTPMKLGEKDFVDVNIMGVVWPNFDVAEIAELEKLGSKTLQIDIIRETYRKIFSKIKIKYFSVSDIKVVIVGDSLDSGIKNVEKRLGIDVVAIINEVYQLRFANSLIYKIGETHIHGLVDAGSTAMDAIRDCREKQMLELCVFVIPTNPETLLGNGNEANNSVEGIIGRASAISVLGWAITNPSIRYVFVQPSITNIVEDID